MKLVKTASGKKSLKISKREWLSIGKKAGWMKKAYDEYSAWDELYGTDSDDGFDARRDFGGDIEEARRSREYNLVDREPTPIEPEKSKFEQKLEGGKRLALSPEIEEERQQQRADMVETLARELGLETITKPSETGFNYWTGKTKTIKTRDTGKPMIDVSPWGKPEEYPYFHKIHEKLSQGVKDGKWDGYLAKEFSDELSKEWDIAIR